jgi:NifU-like protein involved in Fe-S cluster formation
MAPAALTTDSLSAFSQKARARLRKPRTRGAFQPIDAARQQLGLLTVGDDQGQVRVFWLIDLTSNTIADARFLAFGDLASHPIGDAFTELARGRTVANACQLTAEQVDSVLRDDPLTPAFGERGLIPYEFLSVIQSRAEAILPTIKLLPKPVEKKSYQRKRQLDWTPADEAWFKLSLLKKIAAVDKIAMALLRERLHAEAKISIEGLHDDFRIVVKLTGLQNEQIPTALQLIQDKLKADLHPDIIVTEVV